jgi:hypothetical protein
MNPSNLSVQQLQVIDALSSGVNLTEAAAQAGVHRNTIANWQRDFPQFQQALSQAQSDRELIFRERAEDLAGLAFDSLREILKDPKSSPSVRLKAAIFIIQTALPSVVAKPAKPMKLKNILNSGTDGQGPAAPSQAPNRETQNLPKNAQQPYRRSQPKIGRNEPCPCGSGMKYKRCCVNKPQTTAA